ncbi:MAG TPA: HesA/MoeB/ThiF family protein [Micropepsaceae bacterium]|nr:HesA/MoeB/ThiF family protein [Micropepsaceae bacterium]
MSNPALTDAQLERYARHILLREMGGRGQMRLLQSHVLVVGAGGIGSPALLYLAAAGVGHLSIIDHDVVDLSNLQRQVIHTTDRIDAPKVESAARAIAALNPDVKVTRLKSRITRENARALVAGCDLVLDGSDNFATRFAVADACWFEAKPLVSAAIGEFDAQISVFRRGADRPCYRCFLPEAPPDGDRRCTELGVVGALAGVAGTWAALEAVKELAGFGESLAGRMLLIDGLSAETRTITLSRDPSCPLCGVGNALDASASPLGGGGRNA